MRRLFLIAGIIIATSCSASIKRSNTQTINRPADKAIFDSVPSCIQKLVEKYKSEEKQNPPRAIFRYIYKDSVVYYVTAPCCDFFSDLYDSRCNLIGHPDGGFTGRGDGNTKDFAASRKNEKLIWKDDRK